jgi:hypothetical protein
LLYGSAFAAGSSGIKDDFEGFEGLIAIYVDIGVGVSVDVGVDVGICVGFGVGVYIATAVIPDFYDIIAVPIVHIPIVNAVVPIMHAVSTVSISIANAVG